MEQFHYQNQNIPSVFPFPLVFVIVVCEFWSAFFLANHCYYHIRCSGIPSLPRSGERPQHWYDFIIRHSYILNVQVQVVYSVYSFYIVYRVTCTSLVSCQIWNGYEMYYWILKFGRPVESLDQETNADAILVRRFTDRRIYENLGWACLHSDISFFSTTKPLRH